MEDLHTLQGKVRHYKEVLNNTVNYRQDWAESLKPFILKQLEAISKAVGLKYKIDVRDQFLNLETIVYSLGATESGISEKVNETTFKAMIKNNGSLIYQQLFNGKVQVMIAYPHIEGYGNPAPPKMIAIYRPNEVKEPFIIRHMEELIKEVGNWEDFDDDDQPQQQQYQPIGFNMQSLTQQMEGDEQ